MAACGDVVSNLIITGDTGPLAQLTSLTSTGIYKYKWNESTYITTYQIPIILIFTFCSPNFTDMIQRIIFESRV